MTETYPESGARFFLDFDSAALTADTLDPDAPAVHYRATLFTPTARYDHALVLRGAEGRCDLREVGRAPQSAPDPPAWTHAHLLALGRQIFRNRKDGPWPRRLTRWRPEP